ncbi:G-type lectin S-receptor-like serine/threonine-protein kinase CES101 isoform X2 [Juglans microcarpa x Juglans regia]|uniref:G-type lectin S-receptor-like serine/threonine-protein kinase CES101 isoform X2 n=1 Tax=Juglans microcarpa x Juglans regia TaxID=2249226 RepID=UPI001B7ED5FF|nr:G-type lectin S-receptor-like serine/threonine-protein kinase CES101 isoform X2 [Juglans microcarpa x Juglans regia]
MATKGRALIMLILFSFFLIRHSQSEKDVLAQGQKLRDGEHLVSAEDRFRLEFFSPGTSRNRYVGISYNLVNDAAELVAKRKVVWVANRNNPIADNSGNFVLRELNSDGSKQQILWQSFDYPTDTLLPGMKLGVNFKPMHVWSLTSWISENIPAEGSFTLTTAYNMNGTSQLIIWWKGNAYWTSGNWQNGRYEFVRFYNYGNYKFSSITHENESYLTYSLYKKYSLSGLILDPTGQIVEITGLAPFGAGACSYNSNPGCIKQQLPECRKPNDRFERIKGAMSGEGFNFDGKYNLSLFDCRVNCLNNCSCIAYAYSDYNQTSCTIWIRGGNFEESNYSYSREIYVLTPEKLKRRIWLVPSVTGFVALLALCSLYIFIRRKRREKGENEAEQEILQCELGARTTHSSSRSRKRKKFTVSRKKGSVLQFFSFENISTATSNFATTCKLGEGGFGPVYKGILPDGDQEVAIKRLSRNSGQGEVEFKNEIVLIAKLQHTNLVKLVGCCIQREEKMLIYEYMHNKSLDLFIFDPVKKDLLDWTKRFNIIQGIAQGLLYLHKFSRLRVVHRDLKASNILLDSEMNPKISDFGMARIFGQDESEAKTKRVVGTYGYMSPEYALRGKFSVKSDVFSFGVILLEILSGKKNNSFSHHGKASSLIGYAWEMWTQGKCLEIADPALGNSHDPNEVLRCIHVGLLCVQDSPNDRPSMSDVASMIANGTVSIPAPKQPAFFMDYSLPESRLENLASNDVSISEVEAR